MHTISGENYDQYAPQLELTLSALAWSAHPGFGGSEPVLAQIGSPKPGVLLGGGYFEAVWSPPMSTDAQSQENKIPPRKGATRYLLRHVTPSEQIPYNRAMKVLPPESFRRMHGALLLSQHETYLVLPERRRMEVRRAIQFDAQSQDGSLHRIGSLSIARRTAGGLALLEECQLCSLMGAPYKDDCTLETEMQYWARLREEWVVDKALAIAKELEADARVVSARYLP